MKTKIFFILFFILNIELYSISAHAQPNECEALKSFCPNCDYQQMITLAKEWQHPSSLNSYIERIKPIKEEVENILEQNGVSKYYLYLALAESGGDTKNVSTKNAKGLWQLMPYISLHYNLVINKNIDERLDYKKSTTAAAKYIKRNLTAFNNNALWAIAAYNAGGSNLKRITNYKKGMSIKNVKKHSYNSYALAITVVKMIYTAECANND